MFCISVQHSVSVYANARTAVTDFYDAESDAQLVVLSLLALSAMLKSLLIQIDVKNEFA